MPDGPKNERNRRLFIILLRGSSGANAGEGEAAIGTKPAAPQKPKLATEALPNLNQIKRQHLKANASSASGGSSLNWCHNSKLSSQRIIQHLVSASTL